MRTCEICGIEVEYADKCVACKAIYCSECGDLRRKLCYDCNEWKVKTLDEDLDTLEEWDNNYLN